MATLLVMLGIPALAFLGTGGWLTCRQLRKNEISDWQLAGALAVLIIGIVLVALLVVGISGTTVKVEMGAY